MVFAKMKCERLIKNNENSGQRNSCITFTFIWFQVLKHSKHAFKHIWITFFTGS